MAAPFVELGPFISGATIPIVLEARYDDALTDATSITLRVLSPSSALSTYTTGGGGITRTATGTYIVTITAGAAPTRGQRAWSYSATAVFPTSPTVETGIAAGTIRIEADPTA